MKPHIWRRWGLWHVSVAEIIGGTTIAWWPRGVGDSLREAWKDFKSKESV
jgi:hypothetical protein